MSDMRWAASNDVCAEVLAELRVLRREFAEFRREFAEQRRCIDGRLHALEIACARAEGEGETRRHGAALRLGALVAAASAAIGAFASRLAAHWFHP